MFHRPALKVINNPDVARSNGIQATRTSENFLKDPTEPRMIFL
jgi:hypothetical protein